MSPLASDESIQLQWSAPNAFQAMEVARDAARFIAEAEHRVDLALPTLHLTDGVTTLLQKILARRLAAGVRVRLIFGHEQGDGHRPRAGSPSHRLAALGLRPHAAHALASRDGRLHACFMVRDGQALWFASGGLATGTTPLVPHVCGEIHDLHAVERASQSFLQLWGTEKVVRAMSPASASDAAMAVTVHYFPQALVTPRDALIAELARARHRIIICPLPAHDDQLVAALDQAAGRDVALSIVTSQPQLAHVTAETTSGSVSDTSRNPIREVLANATMVTYDLARGTRHSSGDSGPLDDDLTMATVPSAIAVVDDLVMVAPVGPAVTSRDATMMVMVRHPDLATRAVRFLEARGR